MRPHNRLLMFGLLCVFSWSSVTVGGSPVAQHVDSTAEIKPPASADIVLADLKSVGKASLSVLFWQIYDSQLFTPNGSFDQLVPGTALKINYKRNITSEQLVNTTKTEWQKLDLYQSNISDTWLITLRSLWPDIKKSDELILYVDDAFNAHFYLNSAYLGTVADAEFTQRFLAIWLSPETSHPKVRKRLLNIGGAISLQATRFAKHV